MALRMRANRKVLSIAIAQTQTEQIISPSITAFTSQCACQNRLNSDRSEELSPGTGRSVGFIGILSVAGTQSEDLVGQDLGRQDLIGKEFGRADRRRQDQKGEVERPTKALRRN